MRRQEGQKVADRFVDLTLRDIADLEQARAGKIGAGKTRAGKVGLIEESVGKVGAREIGAVQPSLAEIGVGEIGAGKIGPAQGGEAERGVPEPRAGKVDRAAIDRAHLPLGHAQRDAGQARGNVRILRAPQRSTP